MSIKSFFQNIASRINEKRELKKDIQNFEKLVDVVRHIDRRKLSLPSLDTHQFPDWRWLREDDAKSRWVTWQISGDINGLNISIVHDVYATLVEVKQGEDTVVIYCDDRVQRADYGLGYQDAKGVRSKLIPSLTEALEGELSKL